MQDQQTPLHWAAMKSTPEVVKVLIDNGANIEAKDKVPPDSRWGVGGWWVQGIVWLPGRWVGGPKKDLSIPCFC